MKKLFFLCFAFLLSAFMVFASEVKFVQIDNLKYTPNSKEAADNFVKTINNINKQEPDFVVFTGNNIAASNERHLKAFLKKARKLNSPFYIALGHKDLHKKKGLSKVDYIKMVRRYTFKNISSPNYVFKKKGVVFVVADGSKEFIATPFGYYRDDVINWLDKTLTKYSNKHVVIIQHFPIYPPAEAESYRTYKADEYFKMLAEHKNVIAIVSGFDINAENDVNGIKHITTAGYPKYRIIEIIDCETDNPTIWSTLR